MNRYAFYFVVSLLAFGFGVSLVYLYIYKLDNQFETLSVITQNNTIESSHPNLEALEKSIAEIKPISGLDIILLLYKPTIDKWKKGEKIAKFVKHSSESLRPIMEISQRHKIEFETKDIYKTQVVDLNIDGRKELIIFQKVWDENPESPPMWNMFIFRQFSDGIGVIFDEDWIRDYRISKTKTNGFFDIELFDGKDLRSVYVRVFKSNGEIYNILSCYEDIYRYKDEKGIWHKLKKPIRDYGDDCC